MCSLHGRQQTTTMQHHLDRCIVIRWFIAFIILQQGDYSRPCPWRNGSWQIGTKSAHLGCSNKQDEKREEKVETEGTNERSMEFHLFCPDSSEKFAFEDIVLIEKLCASAQLSGRVCVAAVCCVLIGREDAQSELSFRSCLTRLLPTDLVQILHDDKVWNPFGNGNRFLLDANHSNKQENKVSGPHTFTRAAQPSS